MAFEFTGTVKDKDGLAAVRTIIAYREKTGVKVGETQSDANGDYTLVTGFWDGHRLVATGEADRNDLVLAGMVPAISGGASFPTFNINFGVLRINVSAGNGGVVFIHPNRSEDDLTGESVQSLYIGAYSGPSDAIRAFEPPHPRDMGVGAEEGIISISPSFQLAFANMAMVGAHLVLAAGNREVFSAINAGGSTPDRGTTGAWAPPGTFSSVLEWDLPDDETQTIDVDITFDYRDDTTLDILSRVNLTGQFQPIDTAV